MNNAKSEIKLIDEFSSEFLILLNQIKKTSEEEAKKIIEINKTNFGLFLEGSRDCNFQVYFHMPGRAIGAIKYNSKPISTREKRDNGLHLVPVPPYIEIGNISVSPEFRNQKLSKEFYNLFLRMFNQRKSHLIFPNLLIGGMGVLKDFYSNLYSTTNYNSDSPFLPKEIFGNNWALIGEVRPETKGTEIYCKRLGLNTIGSSRSHGGPIFFSCLEKIAEKQL